MLNQVDYTIQSCVKNIGLNSVFPGETTFNEELVVVYFINLQYGKT